jgi:hypothetical protein
MIQLPTGFGKFLVTLLVRRAAVCGGSHVN